MIIAIDCYLMSEYVTDWCFSDYPCVHAIFYFSRNGGYCSGHGFMHFRFHYHVLIIF